MSNPFLSALVASVAAGIPDVFAAAALSRTPAKKVLQMIASGILGEGSYKGGLKSTALGLGLQIAMSFVIALIYNVAFLRVPALHRSPFMFGALYGAAIFVVMNFVVLPLSLAHPKPDWDVRSIVAMLTVMVLFAEIISIIARTFAGRA